MDSLWRKEPGNRDLYVDIFNDISETLSALNRDICLEAIRKQRFDSSDSLVEEIRDKNDDKALSYMEEGNRLMNKGKHREAIPLWNKSLCFVETNSESDLESKCYGFRAVCFFQLNMYDKCIVDINKSKAANAPDMIISWMNELHADCERHMSNNRRAPKVTPKLSYNKHKKFPAMANVLKIKYNEEFDRHIVARCNIPPGQTILVEEAMFCRSHDTKYTKCAVCLKPDMNFIPCPNCANAVFCDSDCASDPNNVHGAECADNWIETPDQGIEFAMRSIFFVIKNFPDIANLMQFVEGAVNEAKEVPDSLNDVNDKHQAYREFLKLNIFLSEINKTRMFQQAYVAFNLLYQRQSIIRTFVSEQQKRFLKHLILHHMYIIVSNMIETNDDRKGVFVVASYFNHACASNAVSYSIGNKRYCTTSRPIKAGQQVFINYITKDFGPISQHRLLTEFIQRTIGFQCTCERCEPNLKLMQQNGDNMYADQGYKDWKEKIRRWLENEFDPVRDFSVLKDLRERTVGLLNRFAGKHWCHELEFAVYAYTWLLEAKPRPKKQFPWGLLLIIIGIILFVVFVAYKLFFRPRLSSLQAFS